MDNATTKTARKPTGRQRQALKAARKVLGEATDVRAFAAGRAQPRMTDGAIIMILVFVTAFLVALANGVFLLPGVLIGALFYATIRPMRGIVVTGADVVLMRMSWINGKPDAALMHAPFAVLGAEAHLGTTVPVQLGTDIVKLRRSAYDQLVAAAVPPMPVL